MSNPLLLDPHKVRALALGIAAWPEPEGTTSPEPTEASEGNGAASAPAPWPFPPSGGPARPPVDLTRPAFGPDPPEERNRLEREVSSYQWGRDIYHDFLHRIQQIDANIEHPLAINEAREYVMRMAIAYSGHPDARIAVRALDMLARMKPIGLYEEKRTRNTEALDLAEVTAEIKTLLKAAR